MSMSAVAPAVTILCIAISQQKNREGAIEPTA
jgi:hypothetical protein